VLKRNFIEILSQTPWKELSEIGERVKFWRFTLLLIWSMAIFEFEFAGSFFLLPALSAMKERSALPAYL